MVSNVGMFQKIVPLIKGGRGLSFRRMGKGGREGMEGRGGILPFLPFLPFLMVN